MQYAGQDHTPGPVESAVSRYFDKLDSLFQQTVRFGDDQIRKRYLIAGCSIELLTSDPSLASRLTPALDHLPSPLAGPPELQINIWSGASGHGELPAPPWSWQDYMSRGEIGGYNDDRFRTWFEIGSGILSMLDLREGKAHFWVRDTERIPAWETAAPFRMIFQAWFRRHGIQFAHAAAVGTASGGVLLAGAGGSGKSTTSLLCLASGLSFAGDDYCLFSAGSEPRAYGIYSSAKLDSRMLARFTELTPAVNGAVSAEDDKSLLLLHPHYAEKLVTEMPLKALLLPRVGDTSNTSLRPVKALAAIRALAPSTMQQLSGPDPEAWKAITSLASKLPCYQLELGSNLEQIPDVIAGLLERYS